jgi:hypothetical protein
MALAAFTATLNQSLGDGRHNVQRGGLSDPSATAAPASTTVAANIATLVADGATPTQAHVTTLNTNWGTFLTSETAYRAAVATAIGGADLTVLFDTSKFTTMNQVKAALDSILRAASGSGKFTA